MTVLCVKNPEATLPEQFMVEFVFFNQLKLYEQALAGDGTSSSESVMPLMTIDSDRLMTVTFTVTQIELLVTYFNSKSPMFFRIIGA